MKFSKWSFIIAPNKHTLKKEKPFVQSVYFWLCDFMDEDMSCFPSFQTLAEYAGCSRRTCIEAIKRLMEIWVVRKEPRYKNNEQMTNVYFVNIKEETCHPSAGDALPSEQDALPPSAGDAHRSTPILLNSLNEVSLPSEEQPKAEYGNKEINDLLEIIKQACSKNWLIYSWKGQQERNAAKRLLSITFSERISEFWMDIETFVNNIIMVSTKIKYNTKQVTSAYLIYYNREEIVNKAKQQNIETKKKQESVLSITTPRWTK